jgi:hypothetical protein
MIRFVLLFMYISELVSYSSFEAQTSLMARRSIGWPQTYRAAATYRGYNSPQAMTNVKYRKGLSREIDLSINPVGERWLRTGSLCLSAFDLSGVRNE